MEKQEKIKNIEFLRVIGCFAIIAFHLFMNGLLYSSFPDINIYNKISSMVSNGDTAVDLFFIISGFLLIYKFNNKTISDFITHKLIRLYPVLVFVILIYFILSFSSNIEFTFYDNIITLLFLNGTGHLTKYANAGHFWYVSSMFWVSLFYYYLLKNYDKKNVNLTIALLVFFSYLFIITVQNGNIAGRLKTYYGIFNVGLLRAVGAIGLGYFIGEWYKTNLIKIKNWKANIYQNILINILEFLSLYFIINNLLLHKIKYYNRLIFIIAFSSVIILFLANKGMFSKILNNDIFPKMSKFTYSIYMMHFPIYFYLKDTFWQNNREFIYSHPILNLIFTLSLVIIAGVLTYYFIENPVINYFKNKRNNVTNKL